MRKDKKNVVSLTVCPKTKRMTMKIKNREDDFVFELSFYESLRLAENIEETLFMSLRKNGMALNDVIYKLEMIKKDLDKENFLEVHKN